jgi:putative ABC transport system substrate-binding protein
LRPDALLGVSTLATEALAKQTQTIPIVFAIVADPIRSGFAVSLSRPGRNITGFTEVEPTLGALCDAATIRKADFLAN